ncbi:MAG: hypothetical protein PHZ17_05300 [Sulfurovum sp.]|nr:hypothetical protein [Sulfurovum sp.]
MNDKELLDYLKSTFEESIVEDFHEKNETLLKLVEKYTPHLKNNEMPIKMIKGTAVIRIDIVKCAGRYYR